MLKSYITQQWQKYEKKGKDAVMMDDFTNYVFFSNGDWVVRVEKTDRRYFVQRAKTVFEKEYYRTLADLIKEPATAEQFYSYLMYRDLSDFDPREIPDTEERRDMMEFAYSGLDHFLKDLQDNVIPTGHFELRTDEDEEEHVDICYETGYVFDTSIADLYKKYITYHETSNFGDKKASKDRFTKTLRKMYKVEDYRTNKERKIKLSL
jgi:hypothetical protein